jgi:glutathione S-transferase
MCDPCPHTISGWLESDKVDIAKFPNVHDHFKRMNARPVGNGVLALHKG